MNKFSILIPVILSIFWLASCDPVASVAKPLTESSAPMPKNTPNIQASPQPANIPQKNLLLDTETLHRAQNALHALPIFSGKTIYVFDGIHFFDGDRPRIELGIYFSSAPPMVQYYIFEHGRWAAEESELAENIADIEQHLFALERIDFRDAARYATLWQEKAQRVRAVIDEPYYVALVWLPQAKKRFWHTATIEAKGAQYYLSFHEAGQIWEFKSLSQTKKKKH